MNFREALDVAHALWADEEGRVVVDAILVDAGLPPDEGLLAQARQDAMLAGEVL